MLFWFITVGLISYGTVRPIRIFWTTSKFRSNVFIYFCESESELELELESESSCAGAGAKNCIIRVNAGTG